MDDDKKTEIDEERSKSTKGVDGDKGERVAVAYKVGVVWCSCAEVETDRRRFEHLCLVSHDARLVEGWLPVQDELVAVADVPPDGATWLYRDRFWIDEL